MHPVHHAATLLASTVAKIVALAVAGAVSGLSVLAADSTGTNTTIIAGAFISALFPTAGLVIVALINRKQNDLLRKQSHALDGQSEALKDQGIVTSSTHTIVNQQRTDMIGFLRRVVPSMADLTDEQVMEEIRRGSGITTGAEDAVDDAVKATRVDPNTPKQP